MPDPAPGAPSTTASHLMPWALSPEATKTPWFPARNVSMTVATQKRETFTITGINHRGDEVETVAQIWEGGKTTQRVLSTWRERRRDGVCRRVARRARNIRRRRLDPVYCPLTDRLETKKRIRKLRRQLRKAAKRSER